MGVPGVKNSLDPLSLEGYDVPLGDDPTAEHDDVLGPVLRQEFQHLREMPVVGPGQRAEPDAVHIFLDGRLDDLLGRLVKSRVDHLETGIAKSSSDHLRPPRS